MAGEEAVGAILACPPLEDDRPLTVVTGRDLSLQGRTQGSPVRITNVMGSLFVMDKRVCYKVLTFHVSKNKIPLSYFCCDHWLVFGQNFLFGYSIPKGFKSPQNGFDANQRGAYHPNLGGI